MLERLAERVWCTKSQSSLLNIYFRFSGFQSSLLLIHFRCGSNASSHCHKKWQKFIRYVTFFFQNWRRAASFRYRNRAEICSLCVNNSTSRYSFHVGARAIRHTVNKDWDVAFWWYRNDRSESSGELKTIINVAYRRSSQRPTTQMLPETTMIFPQRKSQTSWTRICRPVI